MKLSAFKIAGTEGRDEIERRHAVGHGVHDHLRTLLNTSAHPVDQARLRIITRHAPERELHGANWPECTRCSELTNGYAKMEWPCEDWLDAAADLIDQEGRAAAAGRNFTPGHLDSAVFWVLRQQGPMTLDAITAQLGVFPDGSPGFPAEFVAAALRRGCVAGRLRLRSRNGGPRTVEVVAGARSPDPPLLRSLPPIFIEDPDEDVPYIGEYLRAGHDEDEERERRYFLNQLTFDEPEED